MTTLALPSDHASTPAAAPDRAAASFERFLGIVAAAAAALLPIVYSPIAASETFSPKYAVLIVLTGVGLVPLVRLSISSRYAWPARCGIAFIVVALISAALSPSKLVGIFGLYLWGEGAIFLAGLIAAWAIGVCLRPDTRSWLVTGLLVGATANAGGAIIQIAFQLNTRTADLSGFGLFDGTQADGMMGNPIHLEAILLGAIALVLGRACRAKGRALIGYGLLVALFAAGLECSSERYALLIVAVLAGYAVIAYRRGAVTYLAGLAAGFGGMIISGAGASLAQRVATSSASTTFGLRIHGAVDASVATLEHRPLLGFGPGQVRDALYLYQPASLARTLGPGRFFADVHDLPANILGMTGVLGFVLFAGFFATASWKVRGAFAGYAAASLAVALVEPMNVGVTPLAFLALGAALGATAGPAREGASAPSRLRPTLLAAGMGVLALVPAVLLLASDVLEHSAQLNFSLSDAKTADALLPIWPESADGVVEIYSYQAVTDQHAARADFAASLQWALWAADRDPSDDQNWVVVGEGELQLGRVAAALEPAQRALRDHPLAVAALELDGIVEAKLGNWDASVTAYSTAHGVDPDDPVLAASLRAARKHDAGYFKLGSSLP